MKSQTSRVARHRGRNTHRKSPLHRSLGLERLEDRHLLSAVAPGVGISDDELLALGAAIRGEPTAADTIPVELGRFFDESGVLKPLALEEGQALFLGADLPGLPLVHPTSLDSARTINVDTLWPAPPTGLGLTGAGISVGVWEVSEPNEPPGAPTTGGNYVRFTHAEFGGRVSLGSDIGVSGVRPPYSNHATHVAGIIAAAGLDPDARGMANGVQIVSYDSANDDRELLAARNPAAANPIAISNHSYANDTGWSGGEVNFTVLDSANDPYMPVGNVGRYYLWRGDYSRDAVEDFDFGKYTLDARALDDALYHRPNLLTVWAASNDRNDSFGSDYLRLRNYVTFLSSSKSGLVDPDVWIGAGWYLVPNGGSTPKPPNDGNGGTGYDSVPQGGSTAKNTLVVGAILDVTRESFGDTDEASGAGDVVSAEFSAWGPVDDGRVKPDIVANGTDVYAPRAASNSDYESGSGTSFAAPAVSGAAALLIEHYNALHGRPASAPVRSATTKGLLIHTATDAGLEGPDYQYGWGVVDAQRAADMLSDWKRTSGPISTHAIFERTYAGSVLSQQIESDGQQPIKVTLAWTDPPGAPQDNRKAKPVIQAVSGGALANGMQFFITVNGVQNAFEFDNGTGARPLNPVSFSPADTAAIVAARIAAAINVVFPATAMAVADRVRLEGLVTFFQGVSTLTDAPVANPGNVKDPAAAALVNDLNVWVTGPDNKVYHSWQLDRDNPTRPASKHVGRELDTSLLNHVDTVEQVIIPAGIPGPFTIHVGNSGALGFDWVTGGTLPAYSTQDFTLLVAGASIPIPLFEGKTGDVIEIDFQTLFGETNFTLPATQSSGVTVNTLGPGNHELIHGGVRFGRLLAAEYLRVPDTGRWYFIPATSGPLSAIDTGGDAPACQGQPGCQGDAGFQGLFELRVLQTGEPKTVLVKIEPGHSTAGQPHAVTFGSTYTASTANDPSIDTLRQQQRLQYLGFPGESSNPLTLDGTYNVGTMWAIGLFNSAVNDVPHDGLATRIDQPAINSSHAPRWTRLAEDFGYVILPAVPGASQVEDWATNWAAEILVQAGLNIEIAGLPDLQLRSASDEDGGNSPFHQNEEEGSHDAGMDLDFETPSKISADQPFYRTHTIAGNQYVAAQTFNDEPADDSIVFRISGTRAAHTNGSPSTTVLLTDSPDLSRMLLRSAAWLVAFADDGAPQRSRITGLNLNPRALVIEQPLSISSTSPWNYLIFYAGDKSGTLAGALPHNAMTYNDERTLLGIAELIADNRTDDPPYHLDVVLAQIDAFREFLGPGRATAAGTYVRAIHYGDPRTWDVGLDPRTLGNGVEFRSQHGGIFHVDLAHLSRAVTLTAEQTQALSDGLLATATLLGDVGPSGDAHTPAASPAAPEAAAFSSLADLAIWSQTLPFVDVSLAELLAPGDLLRRYLHAPVAAYFAADPTPTTDGLLDVLRDLSVSVGGVQIAVDPASVQGGFFATPAGNELRFDLVLQATRTTRVPFDLGAEIDEIGLKLGADAVVDVHATLEFDFSFGFDLTDGLAADEAFFIRVDGLTARLGIDATDVAFGAQLGFLSVGVAGGTIDLDTELTLGFINPDADPKGNITLGEIEGTSIESLINLTPGVGASLTATLPIAASLGDFTIGGDPMSGPRLSVSLPDLFGGGEPQIFPVGDWSDLDNFDNITPADVLAMLRQLAAWLDQLAGSSVLDTPIPLTNDTTIGDLLDAAVVLSDRITSVLDAGGPTFGDARELGDQLASILELDPGVIATHYDPLSDDLTYHIDLHHLLDPDPLELDLRLGKEGIAEVTAAGIFTVDGFVDLEMTLGIDLSTPAASEPDIPLLDRLFIEDAALNAEVHLAADQINATASLFDFLEAQAVSTADPNEINLALALSLTDPNSTTTGGRATLAELIDGLGEFAAGGLQAGLSGDVHLNLAVQLEPNFLGGDHPANARIAVNWNDITQLTGPDGLDVDITGFEGLLDGLDDLNFESILRALRALLQYLQALADSGSNSFLSWNIPVLGTNVSSLLGFVDKFAAFVERLEANPAARWTVLAQTVADTLGIDRSAVRLGWQQVDDPSAPGGRTGAVTLGFDVVEAIDPPLTLPLSLDLAQLLDNVAPIPALDGLSNFIDLSVNGQLLVEGSLHFGLTVGIDPDNPLDPFIFDDTRFQLNARVSAPNENIEFDAGLDGFGGLYVRNGNLTFGGGGGSPGPAPIDPHVDRPATFTVTLDPGDGQTAYRLTELLSGLTSIVHVSLDAGLDLTLPVFFPRNGNSIGNLVIKVYDFAQLLPPNANDDYIAILETPTFDVTFGALDILDNLDIIVEGLDRVLAGIQDVLDGEVLGIRLPFVGDKLAGGAQAIEGFRRDFITPLKNSLSGAASKTIQVVKDALESLLGPSGLRVLVGEVQVLPENPTDYVEFVFTLQKRAEFARSPIDFDLGIPALGLEVDGEVYVGAGFTFDFGFGVGEEGFYLVTRDDDANDFDLSLDLTVAAPDLSATGRLGFLQVQATDEDADALTSNNFHHLNGNVPVDAAGNSIDRDGDGVFPSTMSARFQVDLDDPSGDGRLTLPEMSDLVSNAGANAPLERVVRAQLDAGIDINLHLVASFGGSAAFPSIGSDFHMGWGIHTQDDEGEAVLGSARSAPVRPMLVRKAIATSIVAAILVGAFWLAVDIYGVNVWSLASWFDLRQ
ncbi:MAG: DUF1467 family protein [Pirellulales bacterium]